MSSTDRSSANCSTCLNSGSSPPRMSRTVAPLRGLTLKQLSSELGVDRHELRWLTRRGAHLYDERRLSKKGNGSRRLLVPTPRLKLFQRAFYKKYLRDHAYHPAAYCVRGRGILDAVRQHRSRTHLLHLDITDFFPSVDCGDVRDCLRREGVSKDAVPTIARLFTCENQLPQGAPTSVAIGNLVLHPLDVRLTGYCRKPGGRPHVYPLRRRHHDIRWIETREVPRRNQEDRQGLQVGS